VPSVRITTSKPQNPNPLSKPYLADGAPRIRLIGPLLLRQLAGRLERGVVDALEDVLVELLRLGGVERHAQQNEGVGKPLDSDPDGAVPHVGLAGGRGGVVVHVDDAVKGAGGLLCDLQN
jgi:hypothetical protein